MKVRASLDPHINSKVVSKKPLESLKELLGSSSVLKKLMKTSSWHFELASWKKLLLLIFIKIQSETHWEPQKSQKGLTEAFSVS